MSDSTQREWSLRPFVRDDALALVALFRETVHKVAARDYTAEQLAAWAPDDPDIDAWTERLARTHTLVAIDSAGHAIGFANLEPDTARLDCLYVAADRQGLGVASALLAALEARARELGHASIRTEASRTALPFFLARDFAIERWQTVVRHGVEIPNVVMRKLLGA